MSRSPPPSGGSNEHQRRLSGVRGEDVHDQGSSGRRGRSGRAKPSWAGSPLHRSLLGVRACPWADRGRAGSVCGDP
ncbi:MAG: hypothetical protein GY820_39445 [Gammaproteobacteria bacterium]|nr:hypothetical protein [Gammaproteobacteria bacterium]